MSALYCTHCDRPLDGHDDGACKRRMSRRFFFRVLGGAAAATVAAEPLYKSGVAIARAAKGGLFNPRIDLKPLYEEALRQIRQEALSDMNTMLDRWNVGDLVVVHNPDPVVVKRLSDPIPPSCVVWPPEIMSKAEFRKKYPEAAAVREGRL